jgi:hypothetical protein
MVTEGYLSLPQGCGMACHNINVVEDTGAFENGPKPWIFNKAFKNGLYREAIYKYKELGRKMTIVDLILI